MTMTRSRLLRVRLSVDEYAALVAAADALGITVSALARRRVMLLPELVLEDPKTKTAGEDADLEAFLDTMPNACHFCGSMDVVDGAEEGGPTVAHYLRCNACLACGPWCDDHKDALSTWNRTTRRQRRQG